MPFQSVSPEARGSGLSVDSSLDGDFTSSDELVASIPRPYSSSMAIESVGSPNLTRSQRPGSGHVTTSHPSTPRRGHDILKGTGPELQPGSARRARSHVTYNIKELSDKTRASSRLSPKKTSLEDHTTRHVAPGSRRHRSDPPTYNLQGLIKQTRTMSKPTRKLANKFLIKYKKVQKRQGRPSKRAAGDEEAYDRRFAKRRRLEDDGSGGVPDTEDAAQILGRNSASPEVSKLIEYITPILFDGDLSNPRGALASSVFNCGLLSLPQQRAIEWSPGRVSSWKFRHNIDITALLMQVTGDLAPSACSKCRAGRGLFSSCILLSSKTDPGNIYGCANCVYHGKQTYCSYKTWSREGPAKKIISTHVLKNKRQAGEYHQNVFPDAGRERGAQEGESATDDMTRPNGARQSLVHQGQVAGAATRSGADNRRAATEDAITRTIAKDTSLAIGGRPAELLSMELWERAPGRIRSSVSDSVGSKFVFFLLLSLCADSY